MAFKSCFKFFGQIIQKISSILSKLRENAKKDMALATASTLCFEIRQLTAETAEKPVSPAPTESSKAAGLQLLNLNGY